MASPGVGMLILDGIGERCSRGRALGRRVRQDHRRCEKWLADQ